MLKRIVGLVVGTTVACSAFAASAATVTSTSTYGSDGKVTVANEVAGVEAGQTLTYLAYEQSVTDLDALIGDNIVYIDQVSLASTDVVESVYSFSYTADATKALNANVKIGGTIDAGDDAVIAGPMCTVTGDGIVSKNVAQASADTYVEIETTGTPATILSVSVNGTPIALKTDWYYGAANSIFVKGSYFAGSTADVDVVYDATEEAVITTTGVGYTADGNLIVVGQVVGNATDYGAMISLDGGQTYKKFAALGRGSEGQFAIRITGASTLEVPNNEVYAFAYCVGAADEAGKTAKVTVGGTENVSGTWVPVQ